MRFEVLARERREVHSSSEGEGRMSIQAQWPPDSRTAAARVIPRPRPPPVTAIVRPAREKSEGVGAKVGVAVGSWTSIGCSMLPILRAVYLITD